MVVSREAIVTPAVRDELLRRGIALEQADSLKDRPASVRLALMTAGTDFDPTSLVAALAREGFQVEPSASDCLIAAVDALAAEVAKPDTLGVLVTPHAAAGLCLANRLSGVRAVAGVDAPAVAAASAAVGANLLVVDPRAGTFLPIETSHHGIRPRRSSPLPGRLPQAIGVGARTMRIGDVIGTVTLNRAHPSLLGASFKLVAPLSWDNLAGRWDERLEEIAVYDELGAGLGSRIAISEGREAAMPFHPEVKPIDAYNAAILDTLDYVTPETE